MSKLVPFVHQRTIRFGETDAAGIVYTPRFSDFCMEAAEVWFRDCLDFDWYRMNVDHGLGTPIVHMEIDFKGPLRGGDVLGVEVLVDRVGTSSLTLLFNGVKEGGAREDREVFLGKYIYCFASGNKKAIPIPEKQLAAISDYIDEGGGVNQ